MTITHRILLGALAVVLSASHAQAQGYKVIANAAVVDGSLSREQLSRLFLKQDAKFPGGTAAVPVDQIPASPTRAAFSQSALGRDVNSVRTFWQARIFTGRGVPPVEKATDAEVMWYVAATPGAIGYVSPTASLFGGVKLLHIAE